jgi:hypothetical protein
MDHITRCHKTRSKSKEEAVCGAINVNTATDHNPNNDMRRFLQPAHDVAIVVPATTTTIVEPNRQRQLQGKTSTRQDTVVVSKEDDVKTSPPLHTGKSIEDMELIVVQRFEVTVYYFLFTITDSMASLQSR